MTEKNCCGSDVTVITDNKLTTTEEKPSIESGGYISEFSVTKMDCASEERMIRLALDAVQQSIALEFDIPARQVRAFHSNAVEEIITALESLGLGATLISSQKIDNEALSQAHASASGAKFCILGTMSNQYIGSNDAIKLTWVDLLNAF